MCANNTQASADTQSIPTGCPCRPLWGQKCTEPCAASNGKWFAAFAPSGCPFPQGDETPLWVVRSVVVDNSRNRKIYLVLTTISVVVAVFAALAVVR